MIKKKVITFFILLITFVIILIILEVSQFGTLAGFAVSDSIRNFDFDISSFLIYLSMFTAMFFIVLSSAKLRQHRNRISRIKTKQKNGLINLDLG